MLKMEGSGIKSDDFAGLLAALGRGMPTTNTTTPAPLSSTPALVVPQAPLIPQMPHMHSQLQSNPLIWQPVPAGSFPNMYPQPQFIAPSMQTAPTIAPPSAASAAASVEEATKKTINPWVVGLLIAAVVVCATIAWMRLMSVNTKDQEDEEEDEKEDFKAAARKDPREIPAPASGYAYKPNQPVEDFVAANVLKYVNSDYNNFEEVDGGKEREKEDDGTIDITGMDIPLQFAPPSPEIIRSGGGGSMKKRIVADESQEVLDYAKRREALFSEKSS